MAASTAAREASVNKHVRISIEPDATRRAARARGRRWPACEAEAKRPHMKFTKQFCGAVPVQAELRKYRAALARAPNDVARAPIRAAIAAYEAGRIYR